MLSGLASVAAALGLDSKAVDYRPWRFSLAGRRKFPYAAAERSSPKELVAMAGKNKTGRQQRRHAAFAETYRSITQRFGGEARRRRRSMARDASHRAWKAWRTAEVAASAVAAKEKAIGQNA